MLEHGGQLHYIAARYNRPLVDWLDLSTGINPNSWPVPNNLPNQLWSHLPESNDELLNAAQQYYQTENLLAVAGSQAVIQALPRLRPHSRVGVLSPAYAEHAHCWQQAGHQVTALQATDIAHHISQLDVLIVINPNNPTAEIFSYADLCHWHQTLQQRNGWLIVDEAFIEASSAQSLIPLSAQPGLIILRSLGKFFGLAGLRVGFVGAEPALLRQLENYLGPWPIAHVSRYLAQHALRDHDWQTSNQIFIQRATSNLTDCLNHHHLTPDGVTHLFQWIKTPAAQEIHDALCQQGILTRLFSQPNSLRFGLPPDHQALLRLDKTLTQIRHVIHG